VPILPMESLEVILAGLLSAGLGIHLRRRQRQNRDRSAEEKDQEPTTTTKPTTKPSPAPLAKGAAAVPQEQAAETTAELRADDLLEEARIYLRYGHLAQAAVVLRWYVDMQPQDRQAIALLLDTYLELADMNAFTQILEVLGEQQPASKDPDWWRSRLEEGLRLDPGNLELRVLAERCGWLDDATAAGELVPTMSPKEVLDLVRRNPDPDYATSILSRALLQSPRNLPLYAELLRILHEQGHLELYAETTLLFFLAVGMGGAPLRQRLLRIGQTLGPHPWWKPLSAWDGDREFLITLAEHRGMEIPRALRLPSDHG